MNNSFTITVALARQLAAVYGIRCCGPEDVKHPLSSCYRWASQAVPLAPRVHERTVVCVVWST